MAYQAPYDFSSSYPFQMDQQMDKVVVQEKIFPNKLLQMTTRVKFRIHGTNVMNVYVSFTYCILHGRIKAKGALFIYHKVASVLYEK